MECPKEQGAFRVDYDLPMENVVDYELGGAKGTYLFDPDNMVHDAPTAPASRASSRWASSTSCSAGTTCVFLIILLLGARTLRDVAKFATVFTVAHSVTLALALLGVVDVPGAIVEPLIAASIVYVAAAQVLGYESVQALPSCSASACCTGSGSPAR